LLGYHNAGICFGNSRKTNGLRINFDDKDVNLVNGINFSGLSNPEIMNGLSLGVLASHGSFFNGLIISGLVSTAEKINGVGIAALTISADTLNGLFFSLSGVSYLSGIEVEQINVLSLGLIAGAIAKNMNGASIGIVQNNIDNHSGIMIAIVNRSKNLHGFQFGLLNYAGNNRKLFRWLPIINFNLRKNANRFEQYEL
jgi:hypothetical protein